MCLIVAIIRWSRGTTVIWPTRFHVYVGFIWTIQTSCRSYVWLYETPLPTEDHNNYPSNYRDWECSAGNSHDKAQGHTIVGAQDACVLCGERIYIYILHILYTDIYIVFMYSTYNWSKKIQENISKSIPVTGWQGSINWKPLRRTLRTPDIVRWRTSDSGVSIQVIGRRPRFLFGREFEETGVEHHEDGG